MRRFILIASASVLFASSTARASFDAPDFRWWVQQAAAVRTSPTHPTRRSPKPTAWGSASCALATPLRCSEGGWSSISDIRAAAWGATGVPKLLQLLQIDSFQAGARVRQAAGDFFSVYARVAGILDVEALNLSSSSDGSAALGQTVVTGARRSTEGSSGSSILGDTPTSASDCSRSLATPFYRQHLSTNWRRSRDRLPKRFRSLRSTWGLLNASGLLWRISAAVHF